MKLSKWAIKEGICYQTAWKWHKKGLIEGAYESKSGSLFVRDDISMVQDAKQEEKIKKDKE